MKKGSNTFKERKKTMVEHATQNQTKNQKQNRERERIAERQENRRVTMHSTLPPKVRDGGRNNPLLFND